MEITITNHKTETHTIDLPAYFCDGTCHAYKVFGEGQYDCIQVSYSPNGYIPNSVGTGILDTVCFNSPCTKEVFEEKLKIAKDFIADKMKVEIIAV